MKKLISLVITLLLVFSAFSVLASAEGDWNDIWVTHYDDINVEGAGVVFTTSYTGGAWWRHFAFTPVEGKANVYEITAIDATESGAAKELPIPEGGFVIAFNTGNNWPELCTGLTGTGTTWYDDAAHLAMPNYQSAGVTAAWTTVAAWNVGDVFEFQGIDLENKTVPTSTSDKQWYEEGYVCTAKYRVTTKDGETSGTETSEVAAASSEVSVEASSEDVSSSESSSVSAVSAEPVATSEPASDDTESDSNTLLYILIAAAVVIIGVVAFIIIKKRKK